MSRKIVLNFDDFCDENNKLNLLYKLKEALPKLKVTLFVIPMKTSLDLLHKVSLIDWIEMAMHGLYHTPKEFGMYDKETAIEKIKEAEDITQGLLVKGFKCFSEDTEILTNSGWVVFSILTKNMKVATINTKNNYLEYQLPNKIFSYDYSGDLIQFGNKRFSALVTPNHRMYIRNRKTLKKQFKQAQDLLGTEEYDVLRQFKWKGKEQKYFFLPKYQKTVIVNAKYHHSIFRKRLKINMDEWLVFLGLFLSEGSLDKNTIRIYQNLNNLDKLFKKLKKIPFNLKKYKLSRTEGYIKIYSKQLVTYLTNLKLTYSFNKYIPEEFKMLSERQLNILLDSLILGDGGIRKDIGKKSYGMRRYYTTSSKLADDVQELFFKTNSVANIRVRKSKGKLCVIKEKPSYFQKYNQYIVSESYTKIVGIRKKNTKKIKYKGKVYCVETNNGTLVVRRNRQPFISGNSPQWAISKGTLEALKELNYWVATHPWASKDLAFPSGLKSYRWNITASMYFPKEGDLFIHGHIQDVESEEITFRNGLEQNFDTLLQLEGDFKFISEVVE